MKNILMLVMFSISILTFSNAMSAGDKTGMVPDIEGKKLIDNTGGELGEIDAVGKLDGAGELMVIIGLEGDTKEVAVPLNLIDITTDGTVTTSLSKAELESYEDVDPWDYEKVDADDSNVTRQEMNEASSASR